MSNSKSQSRILWIDSMRGFSMILVVLGHVLLYMGIGGEETRLSSFLMSFRLPLFFFVSGFFSYRILSWWNKRKIIDVLTRKFRAQILCTIIFISIYQYITTSINGGGLTWITSGFGMYWFCIVLFQMYIIYLAISILSRLIKNDIVIPTMIILSLAGIYLAARPMDNNIGLFLCWQNLFHYIQFFTLGLICSKYRDRFLHLITQNWFITSMIIGWVLCFLEWDLKWLEQNYFHVYYLIRYIFTKYFALLTIIIAFKYCSRYLSGPSQYAVILRHIGQRTLDIYMIHYFFIPDMQFLSEYLTEGNMIAIQIAISACITCIILFLSLLTSNILRLSQTLKIWLFGLKSNTSQSNSSHKAYT